MPWQGQSDNLIDRFDGRAYLDIDRMPVVPKVKEFEEITADERQCNYERYRILAQNDFLGTIFTFKIFIGRRHYYKTNFFRTK